MPFAIMCRLWPVGARRNGLANVVRRPHQRGTSPARLIGARETEGSTALSFHNVKGERFLKPRHCLGWHSEGKGVSMRVWPGRGYPLGATWDGAGVNFALFSEHATKVELCLFDDTAAKQEAHRIRVKHHTDYVWHAYLSDVLP